MLDHELTSRNKLGIQLIVAAMIVGSLFSCRETDSQTKIISGDQVSSAPFMVSLLKGIIDKSIVCSGVLISENIILTSAECVTENKVKSVLIGDNESSSIVSVRATVIHPGYKKEGSLSKHNIALLKVASESLSLASKNNYLKIMLSDEIEANRTRFLVLGRGNNSTFGEIQNNSLQYVNVNPLNQNFCQRIMSSNYGNDFKVENEHICAAGFSGGQGVCKGDKGSPLIFKDDLGRYLLLGIASFVDSCAQKNIPALYTKADKYYDWIAKTSDKLSIHDIRLDTENAKFLIKKNCSISAETTQYEGIENGFINYIKTHNLIDFGIEEVDFSTFFPGQMINDCVFPVNDVNAVFEFKKTDENNVFGVLTIGLRKWKISPQVSQKNQLSCLAGYRNIDIEWTDGQSVSKVYTLDGEFSAYRFDYLDYNIREECKTGDATLQIGTVFRDRSTSNVMIVKGIPEIEGIYLLKQNKQDNLIASIKSNNGRYTLNVKNELEKNVYGVEVRCNFPFETKSLFKTLTSSETGGEHAIFFDSRQSRFGKIMVNTSVNIPIAPLDPVLNPSCKINGRTIKTID